MRRPVALLLFGLFLVGIGGEAYAVHAPDANAGGLPSASHASGHEALHDPAAPSSEPEHDPLRCTCIGLCHGAAAAPHPAPPVTLPSRLRPARAVEPDRLPAAPPAPRDPFLLPYANAPPLA